VAIIRRTVSWAAGAALDAGSDADTDAASDAASDAGAALDAGGVLLLQDPNVNIAKTASDITIAEYLVLFIRTSILHFFWK